MSLNSDRLGRSFSLIARPAYFVEFVFVAVGLTADLRDGDADFLPDTCDATFFVYAGPTATGTATLRVERYDW